jgi:hypothetical protein
MKSPTEAEVRTRLLNSLFMDYERCQEFLEKFTKRLSENPSGSNFFHQFEWALAEVHAAAKLKVTQEVLTAFWSSETRGEPLPLATVKDYLRERVLSGARNPTRSTSPMSNLLNQANLEALAELLYLFP